jgi:hypothetical protein
MPAIVREPNYCETRCRRHLSAIRALAQMRKLLKGGAITQINIADKQINTTG